MTVFTVALGKGGGDYEVHKQGCAAASRKHGPWDDGHNFPIEGVNVVAAAANFAIQNTGCWVLKVHACLAPTATVKKQIKAVALAAEDETLQHCVTGGCQNAAEPNGYCYDCSAASLPD